MPVEEVVKEEMAQSRLHLGPIRLIPKLALTETGYDNNLFGTPEPTVSDWTSKVSAGFHMLLPLGSKMYLRGDAVPEYDWYAHHVEQRTFGGLYQGSWLGFFNRMSTQLAGGSLETVSHLSSENEAFVVQRRLSGSAGLEVNLSSQWSLFAAGAGQRLRYSGEGPTLTPENLRSLDRDDITARAGTRYRWTAFFNVAAEVEGTQANFDQASQTSDNRTTAYLVGIYYNRERFFLNLSGGYRVAEPHNGSTYPSYSTGTGSYFVSYFLTQPIELQAYGHRGTQYSTFEGNAYYLETQNGGGVTIAISYRVRLHGYGEYGTNQYPTPVSTGTELVNREDRYTTFGGGLTLLLFRNAAITALVSQRKITSNFPGLDRSIFRFTTNLTFQGNVTR